MGQQSSGQILKPVPVRSPPPGITFKDPKINSKPVSPDFKPNKMTPHKELPMMIRQDELLLNSGI